MKITKLGHCCLVIEEAGAKILTDPGDYTTTQTEVRGLTAVLITHEHADHLHVPSLKTVLANNQGVRVITNRAVGEILNREGIVFELVEHGELVTIGNVKVEGFGSDHHLIYRTLPIVQNTGFLIADKFFYPGDALTEPRRPVDVLALPVNAPWLAAAESFDYALKLKPRLAFPVHDGNMVRTATLYRLAGRVLGDFSSGGMLLVPELGVPFTA